MDVEKAIAKTNVIVLALPTQQVGCGTAEPLLTACQSVGRVLATARTYRLVIVVSPVPLGWTNDMIRPTLERVSGKQVGVDFGLCYWPASVTSGTPSDGFTSPMLIGESDPTAGKYLERLLTRVCKQPVNIVHMSLVDAERTRLASGMERLVTLA